MNVPDHLTRKQRAALLAALVLAGRAQPLDGTVPGGVEAIAGMLGVHRTNAYRSVLDLEAEGLLRRKGRTSAARLVVVELVAITLQAGRGSGGARGSGSTASPEWRELRAKLGGYQRALREVTAQREKAKEEADALRRGRRLAADPAIVALLADVDHAADCAVPSCRRCLDIGRRVEAARAEYATEAEIVDRIEAADALRAAGVELFAALRDRGVGSAERRARALRAFGLAAGAELAGAG